MTKVLYVSSQFVNTVVKFSFKGSKDLQRYLRNGYTKKFEVYGNCILIKPAYVRVNVQILANNQKTSESDVANIRQEILEYYRRKRMTKKLYETFKKDIFAGKIKFDIENGRYLLNNK